MRRYLFPKPYADKVQKLRVGSGFLILAAFIYFAKPTQSSLLIGVPISLLGLALRSWAAGHLAKNEDLAMSGPYAHVRNPLYVGTLIVAAGVAISARNWLLTALLGVVFALVYLPVIELEEQHLRKLFPKYEAYAQRVHLLLPLDRVIEDRRSFRWSLYRRNREHKALLGYAVGLALLLWKAIP